MSDELFRRWLREPEEAEDELARLREEKDGLWRDREAFVRRETRLREALEEAERYCATYHVDEQVVDEEYVPNERFDEVTAERDRLREENKQLRRAYESDAEAIEQVAELAMLRGAVTQYQREGENYREKLARLREDLFAARDALLTEGQERDRLRESNEAYVEKHRQAEAEVERLQPELAKLRKGMNDNADAARDWEREVARLREALEAILSASLRPESEWDALFEQARNALKGDQ